MSRFSCGSGVIQPTAELTFLKQLLCFFSDHALHFNVSLDIRDSNILSYVPSKTDRSPKAMEGTMTWLADELFKYTQIYASHSGRAQRVHAAGAEESPQEFKVQRPR